MAFRTAFDSGAGGLGLQVLFNAYKHVLEGGAIPVLFSPKTELSLSPNPAILTMMEEVRDHRTLCVR